MISLEKWHMVSIVFLRVVPIEKIFIHFREIHPTRQRHISKCRSFQNPDSILDEGNEA
jgi:hypothetical protein